MLSVFWLTGIIIFIFGLVGIYLRQSNILLLLLYFEVCGLGIFINFLIFTTFINNLNGFIFGFLILIVLAIETAIGLGIILCMVSLYKQSNFIKF